MVTTINALTLHKDNPLLEQDQTLLWTSVAVAHLQCVNSRYVMLKYTGIKSGYTQILQRNLQ